MNIPSFATNPATALGPQPFQRNDLPKGNLFTRFVTAAAIAASRKVSPLTVAAEHWPSDRDLNDLIVRASSAMAMTNVTGWAAELTHRVVMEGLKALGPVSAAAQIFSRGLTLTTTGAELLSAPGIAAGPGFASFVQEGHAIPVRQLATTPAVINPHKVATIAVLTQEMVNSSNAEALITDALVQSVGSALDTVLFDTSAEDAIRPAGLRYNVAALTASTTSDAFEAVFEDIASLIDAIAPVAGTGPYVIVGSPGRAVGMNFRLTQVAENVVMLGSSAVGGNLIAIAPMALACAMSPTPQIESATSGTLVMDTVPGDPNSTIATKSMFQTDSQAIKVRWPISWALRDPRGIAWLTPTWK